MEGELTTRETFKDHLLTDNFIVRSLVCLSPICLTHIAADHFIRIAYTVPAEFRRSPRVYNEQATSTNRLPHLQTLRQLLRALISYTSQSS
jgi:hypothetical protein